MSIWFLTILESIWLANIKKSFFKGSQTQKINGEWLRLLNVVLNAWMKLIYENYIITVHFVYVNRASITSVWITCF